MVGATQGVGGPKSKYLLFASTFSLHAPTGTTLFHLRSDKAEALSHFNNLPSSFTLDFTYLMYMTYREKLDIVARS